MDQQAAVGPVKKYGLDHHIEPVQIGDATIRFDEHGLRAQKQGHPRPCIKAIARCLVLEPTVLLLDEPLGALDLKLREQMKVELKKLQAKVGTTFVYITHDQSEALVMSDFVAVMNEAKFEQIDTPQNLYSNPKTPFVARFVGDNNAWNGRVGKRREGTIEIETDTGRH